VEDEFTLNLINRVTDKAANDRGELQQVSSPWRWQVLGRASGW
jgi:hypothetical protein